MNKKLELQYIKEFIRESDFTLGDLVERRQLRALWTAFCLHNGYDCDTLQYDLAISELWDTLLESGFDIQGSDDFADLDAFDLFMGEDLC